MRLVDADALKNAFNVFYGGVGHAAIAAWIINDAPTVDAVEVVRCRECKWCIEKDELTKCGHCICRHRDVFVNDPTGFEAVSLDDFCSYGERREDG